ncbi:alpha/beta fold hydrolase [Pseudomonas sp. BCA14]|uniref:alpha/beta fold hydrolase n=1 Tax=unclassified Pseudomonas TaxID=196821 RepID=UPI00106F00C2|nr:MULTISPECIES: alpha/beta fold hydrolase [unclassified Pseudomonas]TFF13616.1 alpha/beta fold hydrolase [Pseudomonas sp. JMN1]TFF15701.1 alpha/beta fold hydrolase [Pseudomonas sp. BCA17]TFF30478.1 alpha/beta fold hydrolase [Pseudomonas sp. BCA14]TFF33061.1 alpha/beta fold hydrolase [Pseudomonas sp. BCA13]
MKPSVLVKSLAGACLWWIAQAAHAQPLIAPTAIDWLLDCPFPAVERLDPEVLERTQCGQVSVPRDHAAPGRGRMRLNLTRVGARQPLNRAGAVFIQAGEPHTVKRTTFALHQVSRWESYATPAYRTLVDRYDVIELSLRDLDAPNALEQAARDMEYVREQLGEARLYYLGNAQGTRLGNRYGTLFPERVARMVLVDAWQGEASVPGVEQLLLKASARSGSDGCVTRWLGDFLVYGHQPPATARCLDPGTWE